MPKLEVTREQAQNLLTLLNRCPITGITEAEALLILNMKVKEALVPPAESPTPKPEKPKDKK